LADSELSGDGHGVGVALCFQSAIKDHQSKIIHQQLN
jgi:hypothetical protein